MKYISFDIETAGLEPGKHSVLEFGAVIDDFETPVDELPTFRRLLDHETVVGHNYALGMHADTGILKELQNGEAEQGGKIISPEQLGQDFGRFLLRNGFETEGAFVGTIEEEISSQTLWAAGKNVASFDIPHVREIPGFSDYIQFHHRVLDPGPMYFDPAEDEGVPDLSTCLERAGLDSEIEHTGVADSKDVIKLIRLAKGVSLE
jgi:oligoribonuclease